MKHKHIVKEFFLVVGFLTLVTNGVVAADIEEEIDIDALVEETQSSFVEFGSGWYLRGDVTYNPGGKHGVGEKSARSNFSTARDRFVRNVVDRADQAIVEGLNANQSSEIVEAVKNFVDRSTGGKDKVSHNYNDAIGFRVGFGSYVTPSFRTEFSAEAILKSNLSREIYQGFSGRRFITHPGLGKVTEVFDAAGTLKSVTTHKDNKTVATVYEGNRASETTTENGKTSEKSYKIDEDKKTFPIFGSSREEYSYSAANFMINGYYDLPSFNAFTPYVGAGVGLARINYNVKRVANCIPFDELEFLEAKIDGKCSDPSGHKGQQVKDHVLSDDSFTYWRPSWQLSAGVGVRVSDRMSLDLGYSYLNMGHGAKFKYRDGQAFNPEGTSIHRLNVGLRYEIW